PAEPLPKRTGGERRPCRRRRTRARERPRQYRQRGSPAPTTRAYARRADRRGARSLDRPSRAAADRTLRHSRAARRFARPSATPRDSCRSRATRRTPRAPPPCSPGPRAAHANEPPGRGRLDVTNLVPSPLGRIAVLSPYPLHTMRERAADLLLDHLHRDPAVSRDLGIGHAVHTAQQKHLLALRRQLLYRMEQQLEVLAPGDVALRGRQLRLELEVVDRRVTARQAR